MAKANEAVAERTIDLRKLRVIREHEDTALVPDVDPKFIPFGVYDTVLRVLEGVEAYLPIYIFGDSGYGKTKMIEQACAVKKRELVEVSITEQTSEEDLIGKYRLFDGSMVWEDGPVLVAMKRGAILLLDEVDYATARATAELQMVLRFRKYYIKKTGELVVAKPGFMVFATANTKGDGEGSSEFIGTVPLNRAFRERFRAVLRHDAPAKATEERILSHFTKDKEVIKRLVFWADSVRKTRAAGAAQFEVTTARLIAICELAVVTDIDEAVRLAVSNLYSEEFKTAVYNIWIKLGTGSAGPSYATAPRR